MPISKENKPRYPKNWKLVSLKLIWERANNRCELCGIENGAIHSITGKKQTLSVAHIDHIPEHMDESNLIVLCNYDHLNHDRKYHLEQKFLNKNKRHKPSGSLP